MSASGFEVLFIGGLGNQLFQFALGESLHLLTGAEVRYSTAAFPDRNGRTLGIPHAVFRPGSLPRAADGNVGRRPPWGLLPLAITSPGLPTGLRRSLGDGLLRSRGWYVERDLDFDAGLAEVRPPARLVGFWQSWRYSAERAEMLRERLHPHLRPVARSGDDTATVAVHVRLGDRRNRAEAAVHFALTPEYYRAAIDLLRARHGRLTVVLFSDDLPAAVSLLGDADDLVLGDDPGADAWEVLSRMAACDHHVVANSSLSWWAARLGSEDRGDVVGPRRWYQSRAISPEDRYPPGWLMV